MPLAKHSQLDYLHALIKLGRISNLPTVWSNCLAGFLLGEGRDWNLFYVLATGATAIYLGGMFMNDACDADHDRQHRRERPIPAGVILEWKVWFFSFLFFGGGMVILSLLGKAVSQLGLALLGNVVLYNLFHKKTVLAPVVMALCRLFLILMAAAGGGQIEVEGFTLWYAAALAAYIVGLSFLARKETGGDVRLWPCVLLLAPVGLALVVNDAAYGQRGLVVALILGFWIFRCLRWVFGVSRKSVPNAVSGLLAGIVLVDLTAVGPVFPEMVVVFPILFLFSLLLQRIVPAT